MAVRRVPVNLYREGDRFIVAAPLPGMEPGSIRIDIYGRTMSIEADLRGSGQLRTAIRVNGRWDLDSIRLEKEGTTRGRRIRHVGRPDRRR